MQNPYLNSSNKKNPGQEILSEKELINAFHKDKQDQQNKNAQLQKLWIALYQQIKKGGQQKQMKQLDKIFKLATQGFKKLNIGVMTAYFSRLAKENIADLQIVALSYRVEMLKNANQLYDGLNAFECKKLNKRNMRTKEIKEYNQIIGLKIKCIQKSELTVEKINQKTIQLYFNEFSKNLIHYRQIYKWAITHQYLNLKFQGQCECLLGFFIDVFLSLAKECLFIKQKDKVKFNKKLRLGSQYQCFICGLEKKQIDANTLQLQRLNQEQKQNPQTEISNNVTDLEGSLIQKQEKQNCSTASNISQGQQLQQNSSTKSNSEEEQNEQQLKKLLSFIENIQIQDENRKECCVTEQWIQQINRKSKAQLRRARKKHKKN